MDETQQIFALVIGFATYIAYLEIKYPRKRKKRTPAQTTNKPSKLSKTKIKYIDIKRKSK